MTARLCVLTPLSSSFFQELIIKIYIQNVFTPDLFYNILLAEISWSIQTK